MATKNSSYNRLFPKNNMSNRINRARRSFEVQTDMLTKPVNLKRSIEENSTLGTKKFKVCTETSTSLSLNRSKYSVNNVVYKRSPSSVGLSLKNRLDYNPTKVPNRRHTISPEKNAKKNIAAERLERLRKSLGSQKQAENKSVSSSSKTSPVVKSNYEEKVKDFNRTHTINVTKNVDINNPKSELPKSNTLLFKPSPSFEIQNEEMEWEYIPAENILKNISEVRNTVICNRKILENSNDNFNLSLNRIKSNDEKGNFTIVVDTNIFLSDLQVIKQLLTMDFGDDIKPFIVIPWMVLQELDFFKNDKSHLSPNAQIAVRYINEQLKNKSKKLTGQTARQATDNAILCQGTDDRILDCALQQQLNNTVIILTNDINLRNKAIINQVEAYNSSEIISTLRSRMYENQKKQINCSVDNNLDQDLMNQKFGRLHTMLKRLFSEILQKEMYRAYGDIWLRMTQYKSTWTVPMILKCMIKYWRSVYYLIYPKHVLPCLETLLANFENCQMNNADLKKLVDSALAVCLHLQNIPEYFTLITVSIKELKEQFKFT